MTAFPPPFSRLDVTALHAGDTALIYAQDEYSYAALSREARRLAGALAGLGVQPGGLLAVVAASSSLFAWMVYATRLLGVTYLPLDRSMSSERRNRMLAEVGCNLLLTDVDLADLPEGVEVIPAISLFGTCAPQLSPDQERLNQVYDIQLIVATSGSEGEPKGVMLSGENLAASATAARQRLGLGPSDLWLCCLPLFHTGGLSILYRCLDAGAGVLLHQGFDAAEVWSGLQHHRVTHISLVPPMLARLLDIAGSTPPPESLGVVLVGGGRLESGLEARARAAGWPLCVSYGLSEASSLCVSRDGVASAMAAGDVGLPLDGFELALSERGRIMLRGPAVMQGYANPDRSPGRGLLEGRWFETGDMGEMDSSGRLRVLGRADDMLVSGGRNIHPVEVEAQIVACPDVDAVAVTGLADARWGEVLVALYTGSASSGQFEVWCRSNIPSALRPRRFVPVPRLPQNGMGKLDRRSLPDLAVQL